MCDPISIGLAVAAAGTVAKYAGDQQAKRATVGAYTAEQARQKEKTAQQDQLLDQSYQTASKLKDPNAQQEAVDARRAQFIAALNARPADQAYLPGQDSAPQVVADAASARGARQDAYSQQQAEALARMTGFGDQLFGTQIQLGRNSQGIGQLGRDKANSAGVLDAEMRAAQFKGSTLRGLGDLAQMIGTSMAGGGMGGGMGKSPIAAVKAGSKPLSFIMPKFTAPMIPVG